MRERNHTRWRTDTLAAIDALLDTDNFPSLTAPDRITLRSDIFRLVCDQTGRFVDEYRTEILTP